MSPRAVPDITHLQFLVLGMLRGGERRRRLLRRRLDRPRGPRRAAAFYQMMARLEDAALVTGAYDQKIVAGQIIKERRYALTPRGEQAWSSTRAFYSEAIDAYGPRKPRIADA